MAAPWQTELLAAPSDVSAVARELGLPESRAAQLEDAARRHRFRTTRSYLALVDPSDPDDPILAQLLPDPRELDPSPAGYADDAVGDVLPEHHPAPGLVHKYDGRALLVTTSACAVYCRFCFRRAYPYDELRLAGPRLASAVQALADDPSIHEVILSGGDPLSWTDPALARLVEDLDAIPHLRRLRIHSRMPVVLPERITEELVATLSGSRLQAWFVTHFNHPRELTAPARAACDRLRLGGIPVLNQAVLLRGVNDDVETLAALCEGLVDMGVKPYYLHQLDRVHGVAHFEVPEDEGRGLVAALRTRLSGIAMPTWVRDLPGAASKTPLLALLLALLAGCSGDPEPPRVERSLDGVEARTPPAEPVAIPVEADGADEGIEDGDVDPRELPPADRVLVADLEGDGVPEVFLAQGDMVRWGSWPKDGPPPRFTKEHRGKGMLQTWAVVDADGDGDDEVILAFGVGRGFADAPAEIVLVRDVPRATLSTTLWTRDGERNQITALAPWPREGRGQDLYVGQFASRFVVEGGVLDLNTGELKTLPGHTLRMGMARAVGDFDGDGEPEVAIGRLYGDDTDTPGDLRVVDGDRVEPVPTRRGVRAVGAGDLDGDGKAELVFGDSWHKNYGKYARYRPNVASRGSDGTWASVPLDERQDDYTVEQIGVLGPVVVAGGNATVSAYRWGPARGWERFAGPEPVATTGSWAALPWGDLVLSGGAVRRWTPKPAAGSVDVAPGEEQKGQPQEQR